MNRKRRPITCKNKACAEEFTPQRMGQVACCVGCAIIVAKDKIIAEKAKQERIEKAQRRQALKTRSDWLREAQAAFNAYIRERDADKPCVSCGRFHQGSWDAGHYRSVGSMPALRFHEDNVHRQCVPCNQHKSGNAIEYRIGLVSRIGAERVAFLEGPHDAAKYTIEDAQAIKAKYKALTRALRQERVA